MLPLKPGAISFTYSEHLTWEQTEPLPCSWCAQQFLQNTHWKTHQVPHIKPRDPAKEEGKCYTEAGQLSAAPTSAGKGWMACPTALPSSHTAPAVTSPQRKGTANALASHTQTIHIRSPSATTHSSSFPSSDSAASPSYIFSMLS